MMSNRSGKVSDSAKLTITELAKALKVSQPYVSKMKRQNKLVFDETGKITLKEALRQLDTAQVSARAHLRKSSEALPEPKSPDALRVRLRLETFNAELRRHEYQEKLGTLAPLADITAAGRSIIDAMREAFSPLPGAWATEVISCTPALASNYLKARINSLLKDLYSRSAKSGADPRSSGTLSPPLGKIDCPDTSLVAEIKKSKTVCEFFEAEIRGLELAEIRNEVFPMDTVLKKNQNISTAIRSKLLSLPVKLAVIFEGKEIDDVENIIRDELDMIIKELDNLEVSA